MTREETLTEWVIPAIRKTWNEKKCDEILKALEQEPCECNEHPCLGKLCRYYKQPCEDAISRQAVLEIIRKCHCEEWVKADIGAPIEALLSVTPQPKTGHWIKTKEQDDAEPLILWECSECLTVQRLKTNYCSNCGVKMFEPQESGVEE